MDYKSDALLIPKNDNEHFQKLKVVIPFKKFRRLRVKLLTLTVSLKVCVPVVRDMPTMLPSCQMVDAQQPCDLWKYNYLTIHTVITQYLFTIYNVQSMDGLVWSSGCQSRKPRFNSWSENWKSLRWYLVSQTPLEWQE